MTCYRIFNCGKSAVFPLRVNVPLKVTSVHISVGGCVQGRPQIHDEIAQHACLRVCALGRTQHGFFCVDSTSKNQGRNLWLSCKFLLWIWSCA
ncbi:hypothetical protein GDO78_020835 [Eleutherodactylus coqui]|uniref:Uncharacterized protein n=1 Tax=Eleutherodactylus coqui TaxID=57060 RepID=A0A8J6E5A9_ELECQ|nr:hypothetical protein GDO78_020835 [Eleutherodactylus coqui]